jgi:uncharacterized membrane protein YgdD (TMEM256/DUF423 family)
MSSDSDTLRKLASILGASGVALGALGSHALKETLTKRATVASWQTATIYQIFHATAILALAANGDKVPALAGKLMAAGTLLFSGSIYGLSLGIGPRYILGPTTPIGGLLMVGGWVMVAMGTEGKKD